MGGTAKHAAALLIAAALFGPASGRAQQEREPGAAATRSVRVPRAVTPPVPDGVIVPGEWDGAERLTGFTQVQPREGSSSTERTEVLLLRDEQALYVAFVAFDREMSRVRAVHKPRDQWTDSDDAVAIVVDPFRSRTRAFVFLANPLGVQSDGIWSRQFDWSWDGIFASGGRTYDDRYIVELVIPLTTLLGAGGGRDTWDVNFLRVIARRSERSWWAPVAHSQLSALLDASGELDGMGDVHTQALAEVIPTLTGRHGAEPGSRGERGLSEGVTVRVPALAWLRAEGTYRPDFSFVESDVPQIAFNERYALFYPEKRPFFLESRDQFDVPLSSYDSGPLQLVHTRTIVRPRVGARLLATPGDVFLGGLVASQDRLDGTPDGSSAVVRALRRWQDGSQAGVLVTRRARPDRSVNTVLSADAQLRLPASGLFTLQAARSVSRNGAGARRDALAFYLDLAREGRTTFQQVVFLSVPADFEAGVGFIPRTDVRQVIGHAGVYWRPQRWGLVHVLPMYQLVTSWDDAGRRVDIEHMPHVELVFTHATRVFLGYRFGDELYRGRRYQVGRSVVTLSTAPRRWLNLKLLGTTGTRIRYDPGTGADRTFVGSYREAGAGVDLKFGRGGEISGLLNWVGFGASATVPARSLLLWRARGTLFLDNVRYVRVLSQYDPDADRRFESAVFGWEVDYGTQLHVGLEREAGPGDGLGGRGIRTFVRLSYLVHL